VHALPRHDLAFWKTAYHEHGPAVMAFLRSRLGNREDAEELMQETFVRAMRAGDRLRDRSTVRGYLFTTAHNLMRNRFRRAQVSPVVDGAIAGVEAWAVDTADTRARLRALVDRLAEVLENLPPAHREAFKLAVLDRVPYREIADRTGWSLSTVKINVYRARKRVTLELADFLPDSEEARP
jgi:RNA polymerase sigma-70 factor (ECF subfamily)